LLAGWTGLAAFAPPLRFALPLVIADLTGFEDLGWTARNPSGDFLPLGLNSGVPPAAWPLG